MYHYRNEYFTKKANVINRCIEFIRFYEFNITINILDYTYLYCILYHTVTP